MGSPERVVKCSLRSARGLVFVSDIFAPIFGASQERQKPGGDKTPRLHRIDYNLRARRNELSAKKKNKKANATAAATSQWAMSRVQERSATLSQTIPTKANIAPATSRKSCFSARQKRWKPPWRCATAGEVAAEDINSILAQI